ncbi:hypothetical protein [Vibrio alginolyticus]|uniref:hypothetical protein n=1 Tax=Vibrio alginolyticus TaxID=663 RepID=UPI0021148ED4|nr:hypothetical protein [Vibrio alginolyticus]
MGVFVSWCLLALYLGVASITTGIVHDFELAIATRVITGIASAGMLPIAFALAGDAKGNRAMRQIVMVQAGFNARYDNYPAIGALLTQLLYGVPLLLFWAWRLSCRCHERSVHEQQA